MNLIIRRVAFIAFIFALSFVALSSNFTFATAQKRAGVSPRKQSPPKQRSLENHQPVIPPDAKPLTQADLQAANEFATRYWRQVTAECSSGIFYIDEGEWIGSVHRRDMIREVRRPTVETFVLKEYQLIGYIPPADALNGTDWLGYSYLVADTERRSVNGVTWGPYQGGTGLDAQVDEMLRRSGNPVPPSKVKIGPVLVGKFNGKWKVKPPPYNPGGSVMPSKTMLSFRPFYPQGCLNYSFKPYRVDGLVDISYPAHWQAQLDPKANNLFIYPQGGLYPGWDLPFGFVIKRYKLQGFASDALIPKAQAVIKSWLSINPGFSISGDLKDEGTINGRRAISATLSGVSGDGKGVNLVLIVNSNDGVLCLFGPAPIDKYDEIKIFWEKAGKSLKVLF
jgi:hypothetical protein